MMNAIKTTTFFGLICFLVMISSGIAGAEVICPENNDVKEVGASPYWSNYHDYVGRLLTVDETIRNDSPCLTCSMRLEGVETSNGVSVESLMPQEIGNLPLASSINIRMKFRIPYGVSNFHSHARFICVPAPEPAPVERPSTGNRDQITINPAFALANDGCPPDPLLSLDVLPVPIDVTYGPRRFVVTVRDNEGNPIAGRHVKWSLTDNDSFRIMGSTSQTDSSGEAYANVTAPQYFVCIIPYFSKGMTVVEASTDDGLHAKAVFEYTRCVPPGSIPPWMAPEHI